MRFDEFDTAANTRAQADSGDANSVPELVSKMSHDDQTVAIPAGRELWKLVRRAGRPDAPSDRADVESRLKSSLDGKHPNNAKREILWMLSEIGGDPSVDAVVAFLPNRNLREDARMALERIPGDRALAALRSALDTADEDFKSHLVQSLRARGVQVDGYPCQKLVPTKTTDVQSM